MASGSLRVYGSRKGGDSFGHVSAKSSYVIATESAFFIGSQMELIGGWPAHNWDRPTQIGMSTYRIMRVIVDKA